MKRRKFLSFLGLTAAVPVVAKQKNAVHKSTGGRILAKEPETETNDTHHWYSGYETITGKVEGADPPRGLIVPVDTYGQLTPRK